MIVDSIINRSISIREVAWAMVTWSREGLEEVARYGEARLLMIMIMMEVLVMVMEVVMVVMMVMEVMVMITMMVILSTNLSALFSRWEMYRSIKYNILHTEI